MMAGTLDDSDADADYVEPQRTSYPEDEGIGIVNNFSRVARPKHTRADEIEMEFS